jgi:hypothetical protein
MADIFDYSGLADVLGKQMFNEFLDVLFVLVADVAFQLQAFQSLSENLVIFVDVFPVRGHRAYTLKKNMRENRTGSLVLRPGFGPGSPTFFHSPSDERPEYLTGLYSAE